MTMIESPSPAPNSSPAPEPVWSAQSDDPSAAVFSLKIAPLLLCLVVIALLCIGMAMIHSATIATKGDYFFTHQLMWIGIGLFVFLFAAFAPLRFFYRFSHWGILLIILPLAYLAFAKAMVHFGVESRYETTCHEVEHLPFYVGQVVRGYASRDYGMVVGHFGGVEHFLALKKFCTSQGLQQISIVAGNAVENAFAFGIYVVGQESGIYTRIGGDFLLVKTLYEL